MEATNRHVSDALTETKRSAATLLGSSVQDHSSRTVEILRTYSKIIPVVNPGPLVPNGNYRLVFICMQSVNAHVREGVQNTQQPVMVFLVTELDQAVVVRPCAQIAHGRETRH